MPIHLMVNDVVVMLNIVLNCSKLSNLEILSKFFSLFAKYISYFVNVSICYSLFS